MTNETARVATTTSGTADAESWAVGLDVTKPLAMVALLCCMLLGPDCVLWRIYLTLGGARVGAAVGFMAWLGQCGLRYGKDFDSYQVACLL